MDLKLNMPRTCEPTDKEEAAQTALDALYTILNVEGAAHLGVEFPAMEGLDVPYHFKAVRDAIAALTKAYGIGPS